MWLSYLALAGAAEPVAEPAPTVCVERLDRDGFATRLGEAEQAWLDLDGARFRDRMNVLNGLVVPCLGDLVPTDLSARWHRVMSLQLDVVGDAAGADDAIRAARAVDAALPFDLQWVGADHHLLAALATPVSPATRKVPEPRSGSIAFDGVSTRDRPKERPALVQVFDAAGVARTTAYLGPRDPLPPYAAVPRRRYALAGSAAGSLLASGVFLGLGYAAQADLFARADDPAAPAGELVALRRRADAFAATGYALVGLSAGLGAGAVLVGPR